MKLFWKIYLLSLFSLLFCTVSLTAIVSYREAKNSLARLQIHKRVLTITAASQIETGYYDQVWPFEMLSGIAREPDFVAWQIVDGTGRVVLSNPPDGPGLDVPVLTAPTLIELSEPHQEFWIAPMRMRDGGNSWQFRLGYDTRAIRTQLRSTIATNALIGFGLAIVFVGISLVVTHRVLRPLNALTGVVSQLERGNLDVSLPRAGADEIGRLVTGFSAMLGSIQVRDAKIGEQLKSLEAARADLETRVEERTHELHTSQARLVAASRQAGMAEVASNVLHNVGNVLNSVNVSAALIAGRLRASRIPQLAKTNALLREHADDLGQYLRVDKRGKLIPAYLVELGESLLEERRSMLEEMQSLSRDIDDIKRIVKTQQTYAKVDVDLDEHIALDEVMEDALRISVGGATEAIAVVRQYAPTAQPKLDRHKVIQILINLINNAKQAAASLGAAAQLQLCIAAQGDQMIRIDVVDNGIGISPSNLLRIFNHGFTTKTDGHGFGLHSAALAAHEMGGSLVAHSDGPGLGACFTLLLPIERGRGGLAAPHAA